jgi:hypothetical protein
LARPSAIFASVTPLVFDPIAAGRRAC